MSIEHKSGIPLTYSTENKGPNKEQKLIGYFSGSNIANGTINVKAHDSSFYAEGVGIATLLTLEKMQVDYLGNLSNVKERTRQTFSNMKR